MSFLCRGEIVVSSRSLMFVVTLVLPLSALAEAPNLTPGEWEFVTSTTVEGDFSIPDETMTTRECLTQETIDEANAGFIQEEEGCEVLEQNASRDSMSYRMACAGEGGEATVTGNMRYMEYRTEGTMRVETTTPMGDMIMNTEIEGRRVGSC
ncbi:hypothetical protein GCM10007160_43410 [Litchfieldella qijiaojingensis]|uniref:DUF3617 family protein n=1 Tax=Litchfieldella qijiaojingensis TaxID=980347 RepID=A0ABQ2ZDF2_9GAMM|nr:DUF3617 family protein [Halomonas qijiaojingensis]GGY11758.1 hypothetical protein GCM10007160_43410 [Halomonas qijiaojingensis]